MIAEIIDYSKKENSPFDYAIYMLKYEGIVRDKLLQYKFNEKSYLYETFAKIILNNSKIYRFLKNYDIIIPVPMDKNKYNKRGYNQTELVARSIAKKLELDISLNNLVKTRTTEVQSTLTKKRRKENVKGAFAILNNNEFQGKRVVLFDDIYTTGSTVYECSKILKNAGTKRITILTIAKD